jgi:hypothetical protein
MLSADVIGKLCSTKQSEKDGREIEREEFHDQYPSQLRMCSPFSLP